MLRTRHVLTTLFVVAGLLAFGSACSEKDKAARQMAQEAQARITKMEEEAKGDKTKLDAIKRCQEVMKVCMGDKTNNADQQTKGDRCMAQNDACMAGL